MSDFDAVIHKVENESKKVLIKLYIGSILKL